MQLKEKRKKRKSLVYEDTTFQPYLSLDRFSLKEKKLLCALQSNSYRAKINLKKMNRGNLIFTLKCCTEETQRHFLQTCKPVIDLLGPIEVPYFSLIYGTSTEQNVPYKWVFFFNWLPKETTSEDTKQSTLRMMSLHLKKK